MENEIKQSETGTLESGLNMQEPQYTPNMPTPQYMQAPQYTPNMQAPQGMPQYMPNVQMTAPAKKILSDKRKKMQNNFTFFGIATFIYALFYTFCLYKNSAGITAPFFTAGTVAYFFLCLKEAGVCWKKDMVFYLVSIELLGINLSMTGDGILIFFDYIAIILLLVSGLLHSVYNDRHWGFGKYLSAVFEAVFGSVGYLFQYFGDWSAFHKVRKQHKLEAGQESKKEGVAKYIWIGFFCCLPILVIVILLLASADAMFADILRNFTIDLQFDEDIVGIPVMIFMVSLCSYALLSKLCTETIKEKVGEKPGYNAIIAITMNGMLAIIYFVFCVIQMKFLLLGENMRLPEGYSYSSYARRGFFQLLLVCLINMVIVLVSLCYFRVNRMLRGVLTFITACTYIMIASSALRMKMYIEVYQLSYLRVLVLWGLVVIFFMMTGILVSIYKKEFPLFRYGVVVVTVFYLLLAFARPENLIAQYNLSSRFTADWTEEDSMIDFYYLDDCSSDAAPAIADAIVKVDKQEFSDRFRMYWYEYEENSQTSWRNFNFSNYIAEKRYGELY